MFKRLETWQWALGLLLLYVTFGVTSCTSPEQLRKAIDERDGEIARLREERSTLKRDRQLLQAELQNMGAKLREASVRREPEPILVSQPGLESLGVGYAYRDGVAVITIPSSISFGSGKADLSESGKEALDIVATVLKGDHGGGTYSIEGHTDTDPISKSSFANNRELSLKRATAVLAYLVEDCEVPDDQCVVVGHGQYRPVDSGNTAEAKALNRRVEIVVFGAGR